MCIFSLPSDPPPVVYEEDNLNGDFESASRNARTTYVHIQNGEELAYECIEINNCMITQVYNEPIVSISEKHLNLIRKTQIGEKQIKLIARDYYSYIGNLSVAPVSIGGCAGKKRTKTKMQNVIK